MKLKPVLPIAAIILFMISCRPAGEGSEKVAGEDSLSQPVPEAQVISGVAALAGCYRMQMNGDTAGIQFTVDGAKINGELYFHWKEKDQNDGTISGTISDSVILAQYTFMSEGLRSVREVIFNIKGDTLYPGYGNIAMTNDTAKFEDRQSIQFDRNTPFVRIACPE